MCVKCTEAIENAYTLKIKCEQSDIVLRQHISQKNANIASINNELNKAPVVFVSSNTSDLSDVPDFHNDAASICAEPIPCMKDAEVASTNNVSCGECAKVFDKPSQLKLHMKSHKRSLKKYVKNTLHICSVCQSWFTESEKLVSHMLLQHTEKEKLDKQKETEERLVCTVCNKSYIKVSNLAAHMGTHTGYTPYECNVCQKKFTQGRAYACHMRTHSETVDRPHTCSKCHKVFHGEPQLAMHMKKHASDHSYVCSVCGKTYCNSGNLKSHMRLHTGDKPYSCHICDRRFAQSNAHSYHVKTHLGERPFACDVCPKTFTTNGQLVNHRRLHTGERPFACSLCPKRFTQKVARTIHMMTHTGNKPHLCSICGKKYSQNSQLVEHMRHHTGMFFCKSGEVSEEHSF